MRHSALHLSECVRIKPMVVTFDRKGYMKTYSAIWRVENAEKTRKYLAEYYGRHKRELIERATIRNQDNRVSHREYDRRWRIKNPHKRRAAHLKRTYGITLEEYDAMYLKQKGLCAICQKSFAKLFIDHCHKTEKIRGLLCVKCNAGIGQFEDNVEFIKRALEYLGC